MIVLDTNVLSELMRLQPAAPVVAWLDAQEANELWLTSITVAEILYGIARLPEGQRKHNLTVAAVAMFNEDFADRILNFDAEAAAHYADIVIARERSGRPISMADAQIAAICRSPSAVLATRNEKDFETTGINLINPWPPV